MGSGDPELSPPNNGENPATTMPRNRQLCMQERLLIGHVPSVSVCIGKLQCKH